MRRIIVLLAAIALLCSGTLVLAGDAAPNLVILYTGDVRGNMEPSG